MTRRILCALRITASLATAGTLFAAGCGAERKLALHPIPLQDDDRYDIPKPSVYDRDDYYDLIARTFFDQFEQAADMPRNVRKLAGKPKQAINVTPLDEIQDSSWFTNRAFARPITPEELRIGPNVSGGPSTARAWTIVAAKSKGIAPGFTIEDDRGQRYLVKFDPKVELEMATGAEAIGTHLFWALGYNVPEVYLVSCHPDSLRISPKATVRLELGKKRPMTRADLDSLLLRAPRLADGRIRFNASQILRGSFMGPITFLGVRKDDPNDVIPHQHRRELRGYRVFAAWVNHNDCREINSIDFYVEEDGRKFVKHYLFDFGAILGSATNFANLRSEGHEYIFDLGQMGLSLASLGLYERPWTRIAYPQIRGIGRFEAAHFDPDDWKPNYPAPIFQDMTAIDAFWAAKRVMSFDDTLVRTLVECAEFSDPAATEYMTRTLIERRDRIGRTYFARVNPLDRFEIVHAPSKPGGVAGPAALRFEDLAVAHRFEPPRHYDVELRGPQGRIAITASERCEIPLDGAARALGTPAPDDMDARLVVLAIRSRRPEGGNTTPAVRVTLYLQPSGTWRIARIERDA